MRACCDRHSNETVWPWCSTIAPISWLTTRDAEEGRRNLNISEWGTGEQEIDELVEVVQDGDMPTTYYAWMHASARLSETETQQLVEGLRLHGLKHRPAPCIRSGRWSAPQNLKKGFPEAR